MQTQQIIAAVQKQGMLHHGFQPFRNRDAYVTLDNLGMWFGPRHVLEEDTRFLQVIPYILVFSKGFGATNAAHTSVLTYNRGTSGEEARLHGSQSIGFGGHISINDYQAHWETLVDSAATREIREELSVQCTKFRTHGLLYVPESKAGQFHIGVVLSFDLQCDPASLEPSEEINGLKAVPLHEVSQTDPRLEAWSATLAPYLREISEGAL